MPAVTLADARAPFILVIDMGTSSLRAIVFDAHAREVQGHAARFAYHARTTDDGGSTLDPEALFDAFVRAVDTVTGSADVEISSVAASSLASNVLALDATDTPLTPAFLYSDTRSARAVEQLRAAYDWAPIYARTGCPLHTSYLTARFLWLLETQPEIFARAARWVSLYEFFLRRLFGHAAISHSFAAWSGMLNHATNDWDDQVLEIASVSRSQLTPVTAENSSLSGLSSEFATRWQGLAHIPWYPAVGDGAVANIGSGCMDPTRVAVTVGTSGAMRVVMPASHGLRNLPRGLWMYRVDEANGLVGGSLNDGGSIFAYFSHLFQVPDSAGLERQLEAMEPDSHGLTLLPFYTGERSPGYHAEARAVLTGWSLGTTSVELWRATMEAIAYRFAAIYDLLQIEIPPPRQIIASGAALLNSRVWVQVLADVLGVPVTVSGEEEASARGAVLLALRASGAIRELSELPAVLGETFAPRPGYYDVYRRAIERQKQLYHREIESETPKAKNHAQ